MKLFLIMWDDMGRAVIEAESASDAMEKGNEWREWTAGPWASRVHSARAATPIDLKLVELKHIERVEVSRDGS